MGAQPFPASTEGLQASTREKDPEENRLHGPGGVSPLSPPTDGQLYSDKAGPPALMEGHLGVKGGGGMAQGMVEGCHLRRVGERVKGR